MRVWFTVWVMVWVRGTCRSLIRRSHIRCTHIRRTNISRSHIRRSLSMPLRRYRLTVRSPYYTTVCFILVIEAYFCVLISCKIIYGTYQVLYIICIFLYHIPFRIFLPNIKYNVVTYCCCCTCIYLTCLLNTTK